MRLTQFFIDLMDVTVIKMHKKSPARGGEFKRPGLIGVAQAGLAWVTRSTR
jgi:hypothetical protein